MSLKQQKCRMVPQAARGPPGIPARPSLPAVTESWMRPNGMTMDQCPDGDVTGEELEACTVWQGVIYSLTKDADAKLLGKRGAPHAEALLLPDFSRYAMEHPFKTPLAGPPKVDDVFRMKACQE